MVLNSTADVLLLIDDVVVVDTIPADDKVVKCHLFECWAVFECEGCFPPQ